MMIRRRAFSLAEILIVISIIVLVLALAVPAFNLITGSKSQSSANNQIAAILGRARSEAIGSQEVRGVFFFLDPASGRFTGMLVHVPDFSTYDATVAYSVGQYVSKIVGTVKLYYVCLQDNTGQPLNGGVGDAYWRQADRYAIDSILPDADSVTFPSGVSMQLLCDAKQTGAGRTSDGYLSSGAILFDSFGRTVSQRISICYGGIVGQKMGLKPASTAYTYQNMPPVSSAVVFESSFGYVLFDHDAFVTQGFSDNDFNVKNPQLAPVSSYNGSPSELTEESWLDNNGYAVLINHYNGSLIKSE